MGLELLGSDAVLELLLQSHQSRDRRHSALRRLICEARVGLKEEMTITINDLVVFAARSGNAALLRERIANGGNVNSDNGAALRVATANGNFEIIEILIENGADVNPVVTGFGPLEVALRCKQADAAYKLLCAGAKLQRTTRPYYRERLESVLKADSAQPAATADARKRRGSAAPLKGD